MPRGLRLCGRPRGGRDGCGRAHRSATIPQREILGQLPPSPMQRLRKTGAGLFNVLGARSQWRRMPAAAERRTVVTVLAMRRAQYSSRNIRLAAGWQAILPRHRLSYGERHRGRGDRVHGPPTSKRSATLPCAWSALSEAAVPAKNTGGFSNPRRAAKLLLQHMHRKFCAAPSDCNPPSCHHYFFQIEQ